MRVERCSGHSCEQLTLPLDPFRLMRADYLDRPVQSISEGFVHGFPVTAERWEHRAEVQSFA